MTRVLTPEPTPAVVEQLLEQRRRTGADRHDEMWDGVLHMAPAPNDAHGIVAQQLAEILGPLARAAGLTPSLEFNLGEDRDYRVPDLGLHRARGWGAWAPTAALVLEVLSPGDETYDKFPFYAAHEVDEILVVDPVGRTVEWFALTRADLPATGDVAATPYAPVERSGLIDLGADELGARIDWPAAR